MAKLGPRLQAVASQIRCATHVDVGADHGQLLQTLLAEDQIQRGIAVENKQQPFRNCCAALVGLNAEVRFGDGLSVVKSGEADCLSICGMGAEAIVRILQADESRVPPRLVLQPNRQPELVREWGRVTGFHLVEEQVVHDRWTYTILTMQRDGNRCADPAYEQADLEAALLFGPLLIKRRDPELLRQLQEEEERWSQISLLGEKQQQRLAIIRQLLLN